MTRKSKPGADQNEAPPRAEARDVTAPADAAETKVLADAAVVDEAPANPDAAADAEGQGRAATAFDVDGPMPATGGRFMRMPDGSLQRIEEDD